jgi:hypothetical protein
MSTSHWATRPETADDPDVEFDLLVQETLQPSGSHVWSTDDTTQQWQGPVADHPSATDDPPTSVTWHVVETGERVTVPRTGSHVTTALAEEYEAEAVVPARGVIAVTLGATAAVAALDIALVSQLSFFFDVCFVVVGLVAAMAVRRQDLFTAAVLPPLAFAAVIGAVAVLSPEAILPDASLSKVFMVGLITHADGLVGGYGAALLTVAARAIARRQS